MGQFRDDCWRRPSRFGQASMTTSKYEKLALDMAAEKYVAEQGDTAWSKVLSAKDLPLVSGRGLVTQHRS